MAKKKRKQAAVAPAPAAPARGVSVGATGFGAMSWDQQIIWICLHTLLLLVPVALGNLTFLGIGDGMPISFDQFDIVKLFVMRATTIVALGAWVAGMLLRGGKIRRTSIDWLVLAFLVWVLVSSLFSIHVPTAIFGKYRRFEGLLSFINYATVYFLIVQVADRASRIRSLARTLVVSSVFVTWYGLLQYAGADFIQWGNLPFEATRSFSTYGNPDLLGGFLVLVAPVAAALAISESSKTWRIIYWIATLMLAAVLITAFTRGAWIGAFAALAVLVYGAWRAKAKPEPIDWVFAGASVLAVAAIIVRSLSNPDAVLNFASRVSSIFQFSTGSAASRFEIWEAAINAVKARPIFGFGADTFRLVFPMYKTEAYVQQAGYLSVADNVHNYPLQLMSGIGIPGFLLLYGTIAYALYRTAPLAFGKDTGATRLTQLGVWASALGYVVHLIFGLSVTGTTVIFWAMLALAMAPTATSIDVQPMGTKLAAVRMSGAVVVVVLAAVLSVLNIRYFAADKYYLLGRIGPYDPATRVSYIQKALDLNPFNDMYMAEKGLQYQSAVNNLVGQQQQTLAQGGDAAPITQEALRYTALAEQAILDTIEFVPPEYDNYVFLASLYNMAGEYLDPSYKEKAVEIAKKGVEVEYYGPAIRFQLARALRETGDIEGAIEQLEFAVRVDPAYGEAKSLLATILIDQGRMERARELLESAIAVNPDDWFAKQQLERIASATPGATAPTTP